MSCVQVSSFENKVIYKSNKIFCFICQCSKPALTEGLEIDQYIWAILNTLGTTQIEEVIIDSDANWKSVHGIGAANIKVYTEFLKPKKKTTFHHLYCNL